MREISAELRRRLAKCKQFDGSIPCWMFRGNEEVKIKQWQEIRRLNKCIVEVTYNGRDWYMSGNTDLNRIFDSYQEAKDGIAANLRRYPNDVTVRRIRHLRGIIIVENKLLGKPFMWNPFNPDELVVRSLAEFKKLLEDSKSARCQNSSSECCSEHHLQYIVYAMPPHKSSAESCEVCKLLGCTIGC